MVSNQLPHGLVPPVTNQPFYQPLGDTKKKEATGVLPHSFSRPSSQQKRFLWIVIRSAMLISAVGATLALLIFHVAVGLPAAREQRLGLIQHMLSRRANLSRPELHQTINRLIEESKEDRPNSDLINTPQQGDYGQTAIFLSAHFQDPLIIEPLKAAGADLNHRDDYGFSTLDLSLINGYTEVVEALVKAGASVTNTNPADHDRTPVYRLLINNVDTSESGFAAKKRMLQILLKAGADINHQDDRGMTPLHALVFIDCNDMEAEAAANRRRDGESDLVHTEDLPRGHAEYFRADEDEVRLLLKSGALSKLTDDRGRTAYDYVVDANTRCHAGYSQDMLNLLKE